MDTDLLPPRCLLGIMMDHSAFNIGSNTRVDEMERIAKMMKPKESEWGDR